MTGHNYKVQASDDGEVYLVYLVCPACGTLIEPTWEDSRADRVTIALLLALAETHTATRHVQATA